MRGQHWAQALVVVDPENLRRERVVLADRHPGQVIFGHDNRCGHLDEAISHKGFDETTLQLAQPGPQMKLTKLSQALPLSLHQFVCQLLESAVTIGDAVKSLGQLRLACSQFLQPPALNFRPSDGHRQSSQEEVN